MYKVGQIIETAGPKETKKMLLKLGELGIGAVVMDYWCNWIRITSVREEEGEIQDEEGDDQSKVNFH